MVEVEFLSGAHQDSQGSSNYFDPFEDLVLYTLVLHGALLILFLGVIATIDEAISCSLW